MFTLAREDAIEERSAWVPPAEQLLDRRNINYAAEYIEGR
jgi:hypothetical protein